MKQIKLMDVLLADEDYERVVELIRRAGVEHDDQAETDVLMAAVGIGLGAMSSTYMLISTVSQLAERRAHPGGRGES